MAAMGGWPQIARPEGVKDDLCGEEDESAGGAGHGWCGITKTGRGRGHFRGLDGPSSKRAHWKAVILGRETMRNKKLTSGMARA